MKKVLVIIGLIFLAACNDIPKEHNYNGKEYSLLNQDSAAVTFPGDFNQRLSVVGYIFTNCPDICPLTTNNMRLVKEAADKLGMDKINYVTISFDPLVDTPEILKKYSRIRGLEFDNWQFLTGEKAIIETLMNSAGIVAVPGDSTVFPDGTVSYYYIHTDRISLVDEDGYVRKNYKGSELNVDEIIKDIKTLY